jgi:dual-specificity kinase
MGGIRRPSMLSPLWLALAQFDTDSSRYFKRLKLDYPTTETTRASRRFVKAMKRLEVRRAPTVILRRRLTRTQEIIPTGSKFLALFLDLLQKIFVYDPARRITAKQALQHPWFKEAAHPDDGTEAARIRVDKERLRQQELAGSARVPAMRVP